MGADKAAAILLRKYFCLRLCNMLSMMSSKLKDKTMEKPLNLLLNFILFRYVNLQFQNGSKRISKYAVSMLVAIMPLFPVSGHCFNLGDVIDDLGTAVQDGINDIGENLEQMLPSTEEEQAPLPREQQHNQQEDLRRETVAEESKKDTVKSSKVDSKQNKSLKSKGTGTAITSGTTGGSVFSKKAIDPASPPVSTPSFSAGDHIYGMLKAGKPWKKLNKNNNYIIVWLYIDGPKKAYKSIGLKRPELLARDYFIIDVAPEPSNMTNYSDRDIVFPEKDGLKFGPELFTKYLSELSPGEHTFRLEVKAYNRVFASGEFTISGQDYSVYADLLADIKSSSGKQQKMPKPGMTNQALQNEMIGLLKNAGWPDIRRLLIVDKDWWLDRVSGGDSPIQSRHMEAAAAAKGADGTFYFQHVTFHQPMLITGDWGKLKLTHSGKKKPILEENINK